MLQRRLGTAGPLVGAMGLGTGPLFCGDNRPSADDAVALLCRGAELGLTVWDTANVYCLDENDIGYGERCAARALAQLPADLRAKITVATKGGIALPSWEADGRPELLAAAIDASLIALQTERIDLWQLHTPDPKVPFADSIGAIATARQAGKIGLVGLSNVTVQQIEQAMEITPIACVQNRFNFLSRAPESDGVLSKCRDAGLAFLPYSPFGARAGAGTLGDHPILAQVARETGAGPHAVVLSWLLGKYEMMIPIPATSRIQRLDVFAAAAELQLTPQQVAHLDGVAWRT